MKIMNILFCNNPLDSKTIDPDFEDEYSAARENGLTTHLFSFESLVQDKDALFATRKIKPSVVQQKMIYRGWMLKPDQYSLLYDGLLTKNYQLVNSPREYQNCHYLPDSYPFIADHTPKTVWLTLENEQLNYDEVFNSISIFGNSALIVKDFVKSQKHYWDTACYIPSAADKEKVKSVVEKFIELQHTDLNKGLVFREFIELNDLVIHSKSGLFLKQEYRLFFLNKQLLGCFDYWEEGEYPVDEQPPLDFLKDMARNIQSNFFSMDIAKTKKGEWIIIELGDGQVAQIPDKVNRLDFYTLIREQMISL